MVPIVTFTANLLAEFTLHFNRWSEGRVNRAQEQIFQVGGKGINVSKMLTRLGTANEALCFPGGPIGQLCANELTRRGIPFRAFSEECVTRVGTVARSKTRPETTFLGTDSRISNEALEAAVAYLDGISEPFVLAVCGGMQDWNSALWNPFKTWIQRRCSNARLAIDSYGAALRWLVEQEPDVLKINRQELETLFDDDVSMKSTDTLLQDLAQRHSISVSIVTDGEDDIWIHQLGSEPRSFAPKIVDCVSATGCGDVFFATYLNDHYNAPESAIDDRIQLASEYASRNAASPHIAEFSLEHG